MNTFTVASLIAVMFGGWLVAAWLDYKHQWRLIDWLNGKADNPFKPVSEKIHQRQIKQKDEQISELKERIQILEKIVTEPAYELNKKINAL